MTPVDIALAVLTVGGLLFIIYYWAIHLSQGGDHGYVVTDLPDRELMPTPRRPVDRDALPETRIRYVEVGSDEEAVARMVVRDGDVYERQQVHDGLVEICPDCGSPLTTIWVGGEIVRRYCMECEPEAERRSLLGAVIDETKRRILEEVPDELIDSLGHFLGETERMRRDSTPAEEEDRYHRREAGEYRQAGGSTEPKLCPTCGERLMLFSGDGIYRHLFSRRTGADGRDPCTYEEPGDLFETLVEGLAPQLHGIYQREAKRQKDVRHPDNYEDLPEKLKDYDRALARWIIRRFYPKFAVRRRPE